MTYTRNPQDFPELTKPTAFDRLTQLWNEQPLVVIGVAAGTITAVAKFIDAIVKASNSRVWKKEVKRRERLTKP